MIKARMYPPKDAAVADATVAVRYEHPAIVRERERERKRKRLRERERERLDVARARTG